MQTINNITNIAIAEYTAGDANVKKSLEKVFGKDLFIADFSKINSFEVACKAQGLNPSTVKKQFDKLPAADRKYYFALKRCEIITDSLNPKGWVADYDNVDQQKWWNWYYLNKSGFRFDVSCCASTLSCSTGGSRPFASREIAEYFAKQFLHEIKDVMVRK